MLGLGLGVPGPSEDVGPELRQLPRGATDSTGGFRFGLEGAVVVGQATQSSVPVGPAGAGGTPGVGKLLAAGVTTVVVVQTAGLAVIPAAATVWRARCWAAIAG